MRGRLAFALLPLVLSLLCLPAWAGTVREEDFGVSEVERSAAEQGGTAEYGAALDDGLAELVDTGTRELAGIVRRAVRSSVLILLILLFCGLAETVQEGAGGSPSRSVSLAGTLAVTAVAVADAQMAGLLTRYFGDFVWLGMVGSLLAILACHGWRAENGGDCRPLRRLVVTACAVTLLFTFLRIFAHSEDSIRSANPALYYRVQSLIAFWM